MVCNTAEKYEAVHSSRRQDFNGRQILLEEFENAALFLRLGLSSTLIYLENEPSRKRSIKRRNLKTPALRFRVDGKHFEHGGFRKRWRHDNHVISLTEFSSNTNSKMAGDYCIFKFLRPVVDGA